MKELEFTKIKQAVAQGIDENFVCFAEDFSRNLEAQLDQVLSNQVALVKWVNDTVMPVLREIKEKRSDDKY